MKLQHILLGCAGFAASVYSGYQYAKPMQSAALRPSQQEDPSGCAFDRLAGVYDSIIGSEERYMFYGLLRWWLLRDAKGQVLEISAGTGRNLPHYNLSNIESLILTDISQPMLQQAQTKYFEELQLQYKQPDTTVKFLLADAQNMLAADQQAPLTVPLPRHSYKRDSSSSSSSSSNGSAAAGAAGSSGSSAGGSAAAGVADKPSSMWRFKMQQQQQSSSQPSSAEDMQGVSSSGYGAGAGNEQADNRSTHPAGDSSSSSSSSWFTTGTWWRKPQAACSCQQHDSSNSSSSSNNSSSSSTEGAAAQKGSTFQPGSFDAVVDTFGLCSCEDPVKVLCQASQLLKPGGKLLLLEHGRSSYGWLNAHMDEAAARHHKTYGCWYNRDILNIVSQAGLQVETSSRWHFGTSYLIVATPAAAAAAATAAAAV